MIRIRTGYWLFYLVCAFYASGLFAEQLTIDSLIGLKQLGFSEAEIQEQVINTGEPVSVTEADIKSLKQAGFSDEMILFLRSPLPEPASQPPASPERKPQAHPVQQRPATPPVERAPDPQDRKPPSQERPAFSEQLLEIQRCLNQLGYDVGIEDGVMGPRTRQAIRRFQGDLGVRVDGQVSAALLAQLKSQLAQQGQDRNYDVLHQLAGGWYGIFQDGYGYQTEMYLDLFEDGSFASSSISPAGYIEGEGTYRVQGNQLILQSYYGQAEQYIFRLTGRQLIVNMPQVGADVVFSRYE